MEYTDKLNLEKPPRGYPEWDIPTNSNWDIVDSAIGASGAENMIINGAFDVWQRATSQAANGYGSADRWLPNGLDASFTITRVGLPFATDVGGNRPQYVMSADITSTNSAPSEYVIIQQRILGLAKVSGKRVMLRFSARRTGGVLNEISIDGNYGDGSGEKGEGISPQKVTLTADFQTFTLFFDFPSVAGGSFDSYRWFGLRFWLTAGSDHVINSSGLGFQTGSCEIGEVEAVVSSVPVPVRRPSLDEIERSCNRYYQVRRSFSFTVPRDGTHKYISLPFKSDMLYAPVVTHDNLIDIDSSGDTITGFWVRSDGIYVVIFSPGPVAETRWTIEHLRCEAEI